MTLQTFCVILGIGTSTSDHLRNELPAAAFADLAYRQADVGTQMAQELELVALAVKVASHRILANPNTVRQFGDSPAVSGGAGAGRVEADVAPLEFEPAGDDGLWRDAVEAVVAPLAFEPAAVVAPLEPAGEQDAVEAVGAPLALAPAGGGNGAGKVGWRQTLHHPHLNWSWTTSILLRPVQSPNCSAAGSPPRHLGRRGTHRTW